jgi:hypothetical protein
MKRPLIAGLIIASFVISPILTFAADTSGSLCTSGISLRRGVRGSSVTSLQTFLQGKGLLNDVTGYFGPATETALKAYQKSHGLDQVGSLGPKTLAAIRTELCSGASTAETGGGIDGIFYTTASNKYYVTTPDGVTSEIIFESGTGPSLPSGTPVNINGKKQGGKYIVPSKKDVTTASVSIESVSSGSSASSNLAAAVSSLKTSAVAVSSSITNFTLINADTDQPIRTLASSDTLDLATLPTKNLNIRANTSPSTVKYVRFDYDATSGYVTDTTFPYSLGDTSGNYSPWTPTVGTHTLTATPFAAGKGNRVNQGSFQRITFTVTNNVPLPTAPSVLNAGAVSSSQINLSWSDVSNETSYRIERKTDTGSYAAIATPGANVTSYSDIALSPSTNYTYRVFALNSAGSSATSPEASATTLPPPVQAPSAPTGLSASVVSVSQINLSWADTSSVETSFVVERKTALSSYVQVATLGANFTSYSDIGLSAGTAYTYRVKAVNSAGSSGYTNEASATTLTPPPQIPAAPTNLSGSPASETQIIISWLDNATNETNYIVERKTAASGYSQVGILASNSVAFADTALSPATTYTYRVKAINTAGDSAYSNEASATTLTPPPQPPAAPSGLTATANSSSQITVMWSDNSSNETGFSLERATDSSFTQNLTAQTLAQDTTSNTTTGLNPSTTYYFRIRATNAAGSSGYSNTVNATTQTASLPPNAPTNLIVTANSSSQITVTWTDNATNETSYSLDRATDSNFTQNLVTQTLTQDTTSSVATGLSAATTYYFRVKAVNPAGSSNYSNTGNAATQGGGGGNLTVPALSSKPGAPYTIFLDFNGDGANSNWNTYSVPATPAYDVDSDTSSFSTTELANINNIWTRISEKMSPFNINVTTVDPGIDFITAGNKVALKIVIGGTGTWWPSGAGGASQGGEFFNPAQPNTAYIFPSRLSFDSMGIAEQAAYNIGQSFGLDVQNYGIQRYDTNLTTAPIMGLQSTITNRGVWWDNWNGPLNRQQNDLTYIAQGSPEAVASGFNGVGFRPDDYGNTSVAAQALPASKTATGVIEQPGDIDYFSFTTGGGSAAITAKGIPQPQGQMLDLKVLVYNSSGTQVAQADSASFNETVATTLGAGTYYVAVQGHGWVTMFNGTTNIGKAADVGQYTLTVTASDGGGGDLTVPALSSKPGAPATIYLDFDGEPQSTYNSSIVPITVAYDKTYQYAGSPYDPTVFDSTEITYMTEIWKRLSEKFSLFNVNVTTVNPGAPYLDRVALHVVIGGTGAWAGPSMPGAVGFDEFSNPALANTVYVFSENLGGYPKVVSENAAKNIGNAFGLDTQFAKVNSFYVTNPGDLANTKAPIMGVNSNYAVRGMWWDAFNPVELRQQDDVVIMAGTNNGFGFRTDDAGNTIASALALPPSRTTSGIIEQTTDTDYYSLTTTGGSVTISVTGSSVGQMLDPKFVMYNSSGTQIAASDSANLNETLTQTLTAGTYYIQVSGHGLIPITDGNASNDYGFAEDVGQYTVTVTGP